MAIYFQDQKYTNGYYVVAIRRQKCQVHQNKPFVHRIHSMENVDNLISDITSQPTNCIQTKSFGWVFASHLFYLDLSNYIGASIVCVK